MNGESTLARRAPRTTPSEIVNRNALTWKGGHVTVLKNRVWFEYKTSEGQPVRHGRSVVTPISRVLAVRLPFWGFVWNRPVAVRVEDEQSTKELPIVDVTLLAQIGLLVIGLAAAALTFLAARAQRQ
jgi:hypothetical protein